MFESPKRHRAPYVNGHNQSNGPSGGLKSTRPRQPRLLNVDEALQYSPFSSIVPFNPNIVPMPHAEVSNSGPILSSPSDRETARQPLNLLDSDVTKTQGSSSLVQNTLGVVKGYLDSSQVTEFKFKEPQYRSRCPPNEKMQSKSTKRANAPPELGPFATMLLELPEMEYRYPTPTSPKSPLAKREQYEEPVHTEYKLSSTQNKGHLLTPTTPEPNMINRAAFAQNARASDAHFSGPKTQQTIHTPVVLVPPLSAKSRPSEYVTFKDDQLMNGVRGAEVLDPLIAHLAGQDCEQRAAADHASSNFQRMLQAIFEADEQVRDNSIVPSSEASQYFSWIDHDGDQIRMLTPAVLVKLDSALEKVIAVARLSDIPKDDFYRLQSLCEKSMTGLQSSELSIDSAWGGDDFAAWLQRASSAEIALRSARIVVKIMLGLPQEKQLSSEEILQNVVDYLNKVMTSIIIPIVEIRPKDSASDIFDLACAHKKEINQLLHQANKVMRLLVRLLSKTDIAESVITALEFFAIRSLFVENAQTEKDSILGIQKFEGLRRTAMDIITEIFSRYSEQRTFVFDEILASFQKLPTKGQNARQYKLSDGTNIQLVSALIVRLIQTSAAPVKDALGKAKPRLTRKQIGTHSVSQPSSVDEDSSSENMRESRASEAPSDCSADESDDAAKQRPKPDTTDQAAKDAQYVIRYLVRRAMTASKGGDQPHRHLLDLFAEDLFALLGNQEWPAAELLLRAMVSTMVGITENKSTAPAKNMALELLGLMGSAISELVASTQNLARSLENQESPISGHLRQIFDDYLDGSLQTSELLIWDGPYRVVLEYLASIDSDGMPTRGAQLYYLALWAKNASSTQIAEHGKEKLPANRLRKMLVSSTWNPSDSSMESISKGQCRLAYALTVLSLPFCRHFDKILKILLDSITSEQTTVRTRSLKSVTQMLEKDPSLLDRAPNVKTLLIKCASDASPMVRDSTLMLMGKCIQQKPTLEQDFFRSIVSLAGDSAISVRKRSMKLLKEIFVRNKRKDMKIVIAECLLQSIDDPEKGISETANQLLEEIWFSPFWKYSDVTADVTIQDRLTLKEHLGLMTSIAQRNDRMLSALVSLTQGLLKGSTKAAESNFRVCRMLVSTGFDIMIDPEALPEGLEQKNIVQSLTIFAKADARLFDPEQLQHLQPYITNLANPDDCSLLRSVVIIFRCVLSVVPTIQQTLLREVQQALLVNVSKLGKKELIEVAACLWTLNGVLKNPERLTRLVASILKNLLGLKSKDMLAPSEKDNVRRARKYIQIAGAFGNHCDFEGQLAEFRQALPPWNGKSVSGLIIDSIKPFASNKQPAVLRVDALNSIGQICQSFPHHFHQPDISSDFQQVLVQGQPDVQNIVLSNFRDFFASQEAQSSNKNEPPKAGEIVMASGKLGGSMKASESDGASALIAQRFLHNVLAIAVSSQGESALTAAKVVASINRQGLVHPKESGPALVALETSSNPEIANVAFEAHRDLHQQHESMFEREYMRAIVEAYRYQKDVVEDTLGYRAAPYTSKLHSTFEIIKSSKAKYQKKFISNYCSKIDFEVDKLDLSGDVPASLRFARFLIENLAFFDYGRVDELLHTLTCMEKIVADTGSSIAHSINTEILGFRVDTLFQPAGDSGVGEEQATSHEAAATENVTAPRIRQLTTASIILSCLWDTRTFLRRLYGLSSTQQTKDGKANGKMKDVNKAPTKTSGITGDKVAAGIELRVQSLQSSEGMLRQCKEFVALLSVDDEFRVAAEGEEDGLDRPRTPSGDEADTPMPTSGGSRPSNTMKRKRSSVSVAGTPHKKRGRPSLPRRKSSRKSMEDNDEDWG
ncbi:MAG: hypothetical protein Q9218_004663 [Villophora microphyllina]